VFLKSAPGSAQAFHRLIGKQTHRKVPVAQRRRQTGRSILQVSGQGFQPRWRRFERSALGFGLLRGTDWERVWGIDKLDSCESRNLKSLHAQLPNRRIYVGKASRGNGKYGSKHATALGARSGPVHVRGSRRRSYDCLHEIDEAVDTGAA
jgi:hypothetical protein